MDRESALPLGKNEKDVPSDRLDFPVVGIGASAGGIQALVHLFEGMPSDSGMAFVVVVHLSPEHESHVDQILQRATRMPVVQVSATVPIEKGHVYVISPAMSLKMSDGHLQAVAGQSRDSPGVIDVFFRTLADAHGSRAVAIVLSGTGADGSLGMARIKEQGRLGHAQPAGQPAAGAMRDLHVAATQHMQEGAAGLGRKPVQAAQRPGMKQLRPHTEPVEQGGQAV